MEQATEWMTAADAWSAFVKRHPELAYRDGHWQFHNFLRLHRAALRATDAIRMAKGRHWVAHRERFMRAAFDCATGAMQPAAIAA